MVFAKLSQAAFLLLDIGLHVVSDLLSCTGKPGTAVSPSTPDTWVNLGKLIPPDEKVPRVLRGIKDYLILMMQGGT